MAPVAALRANNKLVSNTLNFSIAQPAAAALPAAIAMHAHGADAKVEVREVEGRPGWYEAVAYLRPHYQLEALTTSMRLVAEVPKKS